MSVPLFLLECELVQLRVLPETDVPKVIFAVEVLKVCVYIFVRHFLVDRTAVFGVNDEDHTLPQDVVMTEHAIDSSLVLPVEWSFLVALVACSCPISAAFGLTLFR